jgi:hypothetical protein
MEIDRLRDQMESARYDADLHIRVQNKNSDRLEEKVKMDADKFAGLRLSWTRLSKQAEVEKEERRRG